MAIIFLIMQVKIKYAKRNTTGQLKHDVTESISEFKCVIFISFTHAVNNTCMNRKEYILFKMSM